MEKASDRLVVLATPENFRSVSLYHEDFSQVSTEDAVQLVREANAEIAKIKN